MAFAHPPDAGPVRLDKPQEEARVGKHTVARHGNPSGEVFAFEPAKRYDLHRRGHNKNESGTGDAVLAMHDRIHKSLPKRSCRGDHGGEGTQGPRTRFDGDYRPRGTHRRRRAVLGLSLRLQRSVNKIPAIVEKRGDLHRQEGIDGQTEAQGS